MKDPVGVRQYDQLLLVGMNLVDLHGATVIGNSVKERRVWDLVVVVEQDGVGDGARQHDSVDQATRGTPSAYGIATSYNLGINGDFANLQISANVISFEQESSSRTIANNVNYGVGLQAFGGIANAVLLGNESSALP